MKDEPTRRDLVRGAFVPAQPVPLPVEWWRLAQPTGGLAPGALWLIEGGYKQFAAGFALHLAAFAIRAGRSAIVVTGDYADMGDIPSRVGRINGAPPLDRLLLVPCTGGESVDGSALLVEHLARQYNAAAVVFDQVSPLALLLHGGRLLNAGGRRATRLAVVGDISRARDEHTMARDQLASDAAVVASTRLLHEHDPARLIVQLHKAPQLPPVGPVEMAADVEDGVIARVLDAY